MKRTPHALRAATAALIATAGLNSCGDGGNAPQQVVVGLSPEAEAARNKLQEKGIECTPKSYMEFLMRNCDAETLQLFMDAGMSGRGALGNGLTPLMLLILNCANKEEAVKCARILIANGANVNAANNRGVTALHFAGQRSNPELVALLIQSGANVNAVDKSGMSVLATTFNSASRQLLIDAGAVEKPY
ncbi:MAG: ankyrin repeat domain-containing protein [Akkermansia sp.]|nr:ankyrin repeat domain-containing protein [Akkermansia sp.]MDO4750770.1 ankyrin repeat domain-containing protein [Akkermansia sp.]